MLVWQTLAQGVLPRVAATPPATVVLATDPLWYLDAQRGEAGPCRIGEQDAVRAMLTLPALSATELSVVAAALSEAAPALPSPPEPPSCRWWTGRSSPCSSWTPCTPGRSPAIAATQPSTTPNTTTPCRASPMATWRWRPAPTSPWPAGSSVRLKRQPEAEAQAMRALLAAGFQPVTPSWLHTYQRLPDGLLGLESEAAWQHFFATTAPALREAGWRIECAPDFRHHVLQPDAWFADLEETEAGWFELSQGLKMEGRRVDLSPDNKSSRNTTSQSIESTMFYFSE